MQTTVTVEKSTSQGLIPALQCAVLVPHRDCLPALEVYRRALFAVGMEGAFAFPAVAPLALLSRPLTPPELKAATSGLRTMLGDIKITASGAIACSGWDYGDPAGAVRFFGPALELPLPLFPSDAVSRSWERPVLAPALLAAGDCPPEALPDETPPSLTARPLVAFRAAALANCAVTPALEPYSLNWELGPLFWLPRYREGRRG